jgi:hypothetical protein
MSVMDSQKIHKETIYSKLIKNSFEQMTHIYNRVKFSKLFKRKYIKKQKTL